MEKNFKLEDYFRNNPNMTIDCKLDEVYSRLFELTDEETDEDLRGYNQWLLESIEEAIRYIHYLEKQVPRGEDLTLEEINKINNEINEGIK